MRMDRFGKRRRAPEALAAKTFAIGNKNFDAKVGLNFANFKLIATFGPPLRGEN